MRKRKIAIVAITLALCAAALPFVSFSHEKEATEKETKTEKVTQRSPQSQKQGEWITATQNSPQSQKLETPLTEERALQERKEKTHPQPTSAKGLSPLLVGVGLCVVIVICVFSYRSYSKNEDHDGKNPGDQGKGGGKGKTDNKKGREGRKPRKQRPQRDRCIWKTDR